MMLNHRGKIKTLFIFCANIGVSIIFLFFTYQLWERDFHTPIVYNGGDGVGALLTIKAAIEGNGYSDFHFFCAPFGEKIYSQDYFFPYLIVKFVALFTSDVGVAANLFWISTYILTAVSMYIFLKKLGCTWITIILGSTVYNFLPYHYFRLEHFWLMGCYIVPLVGYMAVEMLEEQFEVENTRKKRKEWLIRFAFSVIIGLNGLYYSVFSIMVLTITLFYSVVYKRRHQVIKKYLTDCVAIALPIIILYAIPLALYGTNEISNIAGERSISHINMYGLNLVTLFLPIPGHRNSAFNNFTEYCYEQMGVTTENFTASLGLVMSIGVIIAVLFAFKKTCNDNWEERIRDFGIIILIIFIVATIGGIDNFIAIFVSASIRCYNRLSIFIALFAIGVVCLLMDRVGVFFEKRKKYYMFGAICVAVTVIGVLDVTSPNFSKYETYDISKREYIYDYNSIKEEYNNDVAFFEKVNGELDDEKMLFIAPYNADTTKYGQKGFFNRIKIYILQPEIRTSFSLYDDKFEKWWTKVSEADVESQIKLMSVLGYSGILIDENSFSSESEIENFTESIAQYVDKNSKIVSTNDNLCFYSIKEWKNEFLSEYSEEQLKKWKEDIYLDIYSECQSVDRNDLYGINEDNVVKNGSIQFGPYYSLEAGTYQVVLCGANLSNVTTKVTSNSGRNQIPITNIKVSKNYIQYEFSVDKKRNDIEFVAENKNKQDFEVYNYYYAKKTSENFDIWDIIQIKKELENEFGLGDYTKKLALNSLVIMGNGKITKDGIILQGDSMQYGPYMYLDQGSYQIRVKGEGLEDVSFRVTAGSGEKTLKCNAIEQTGTVLIYEFKLNEPMDGIEFLIESGNEDIYINEYMLSFHEN